MTLEAMEMEEKTTFTKRLAYVRDRFVFVALRELGLRASEMVKGQMAAFYQLSDPKDGQTYWIMAVRAETSKGARERKIPVTRNVLAALRVYREAFGLPSLPQPGEHTPLLLSPRTSRSTQTAGGRPVRDVESRRFF